MIEEAGVVSYYLTDECEGPRVTATNNQVLGGVRPHHRGLNDGEAPFQINLKTESRKKTKKIMFFVYKNLTLCPAMCH